MSSYPRQQARTRRFSLGTPRQPTVAPDGSRIVFLRTAHGEDPVTCLWEVEVADGELGEPRLLVDPRALDAASEPLTDHERARRERARELAGGITSYATDASLTLVAFVLAGRVWTVHVPTGTLVEHAATEAVFDPRPTPDGSRVAYVSHDAVHLLDLVGGPRQPGVTRMLVGEDGVSWGRAEFIAAEEMGRSRGMWWSPDGSRLAVTRVDESAVARWYLADPASPWLAPRPQAYPAAGTTNADVRLAVLAVDGARRADVAWNRDGFPYLARVVWHGGPLTLQVQRRDQRASQILAADPDTGACRVLRTLEDDAWVEAVPGVPAWHGDALVTVEDLQDHGPQGSRALVVDGEVRTPPGLQVRHVVTVTDAGILLVASDEDPTQTHLYRIDAAGRCTMVGPRRAGLHAASAGGGLLVRSRSTMEQDGVEVDVLLDDADATVLGPLPSRSATPVVHPRVRWLQLGPRALRAALLLPDNADVGDAPLPVLLDPYAGPHAQRVVAARSAWLTPQWFANQGFAVLVIDGRGTPGRGPAFERAIRDDLAGPALEDQIEGLQAAAALEPRLDLSRVGIRGWSYGGTLAALAVLRAPEVFRAAVAGAPVTDWRCYDTHYTERYLGHPDTNPAAYARASLVDAQGQLCHAAPWPHDDPPRLMLIHGLADDNVVAAHSLRLSAALLADGRPHTFLPLSGVTHLASREDVAEQLLLTQVRFLKDALAVRGTG